MGDVTNNDLGLSEDIIDNDFGPSSDTQTIILGYLKTTTLGYLELNHDLRLSEKYQRTILLSENITHNNPGLS